MDEHDKNLLLEDLKSPCTEEVAVFHAFSKAIQQAKRKFVVIDTAPTGHTLLLLDTAGSYHREIMRNTGMDQSKLKTPYMSLQDPDLSKVILLSLPETTPMREAAALQEDLKRAGITPYAWIVNQSLSMQDGLKDPLLRSRALAEVDVINTIEADLTDKIYGIPYLPKNNFCRHYSIFTVKMNVFNKASAVFRDFESTENFLLQKSWSSGDVNAALALFFVGASCFFLPDKNHILS